jgi:hypothetical protein
MNFVYLILFILWAVIVVITIVLAVKKGYSGFLAFLLGLFIPLFGSLIIIALLPDKYETSPSVNSNTSDKGNSSGPDLSKVEPMRRFNND